MRRYFIIAIFGLASLWANAQDTPFTFKQGVFGDEVRNLLNNANSQEAVAIGESFAIAWKDYTPDLQTKIINQTRQMMEAGYNTRPHLLEYFGALAAAINDEHAPAKVLTDYLNVAQKVIDEFPSKKAVEFFKTSRTFLKKEHYILLAAMISWL